MLPESNQRIERKGQRIERDEQSSQMCSAEDPGSFDSEWLIPMVAAILLLALILTGATLLLRN